MSITEVNIDLFRMINDLGKELTALNPIFVFIAEYTIYFIALWLILLLFTRNKINRVTVLCALISVVFAELIGKLVGQLHFNYQPFVDLADVNKLIEKEVGNSFPSDHTIIFFAVCVTLWMFKKGWGVLWLVLAILVGVSRIWVGVHYPADVVTGAIISTVVAIVVYTFVPKLSFVRKLTGANERG